MKAGKPALFRLIKNTETVLANHQLVAMPVTDFLDGVAFLNQRLGQVVMVGAGNFAAGDAVIDRVDADTTDDLAKGIVFGDGFDGLIDREITARRYPGFAAKVNGDLITSLRLSEGRST